MKPTVINLRYEPRKKVLWGLLSIAFGLAIFFESGDPGARIVVGPLFVLLGLGVIGYLDRLRIDSFRGRLLHQRGWLLPFSTRDYPISKIRHITLKEKTRSTGESTRTRFPIHLSGIRDAVVARPGALYFAREIAERLAHALNKPLNNRIYRVSSFRSPDALDRPVTESWKRDSEHLSAPLPPADSDLIIERTPDSVSISVTRDQTVTAFILAFIFLLSLISYLVFGVFVATEISVYVIFFVAYLVLTWFLLICVGRARLRIDRRQVSLRLGWWPFQFKMGLDEVEEFIVAADSIVLVGDSAVLSLDWTGNVADNEYLEAMIPYELMRFAHSGPKR